MKKRKKNKKKKTKVMSEAGEVSTFLHLFAKFTHSLHYTTNLHFLFDMA